MTSILLGFLLAFAESAMGLGAVLPGEVAISTLAALAHGSGATLALGTSVALGAVAGDHVGFLVGRRAGVRFRESRLVARLGVGRWDRAVGFVQRHGFWAMLVSRLLPVVRAVMPVVAGAAAMRYRTFLLASSLGAVTWASVWIGAGAGIASSGALEHPGLLAAAGALVLASVLGRRAVLRHRRKAVAGPSRSVCPAPPRRELCGK